jgi:peptide/nickel transport system permease protein
VVALVVRRLLTAIPVLWGVLTLTFIGFQIIPGGPVQAELSARGVNGVGRAPSPANIKLLEHQLGLDQPLPVRYERYVSQVAHGDLGRSFASGEPVWDLIAERLPYTVELGLTAWLLSGIMGVVSGVAAAVWNRRPLGMAISSSAVLLMSLPSFWLGAMLALVFGVDLRWLPVAGTPDFRHLVLPAVTLAAALTARLTRQTRAALLEALNQDFIRTARAKGLGSGQIILCHALRNALVPLVTILGLEIAGLLSGVVVVEKIFSWPGLGVLTVNAIGARDYPVIEGTTLLFASILIAANIAVDLSYYFLDPRIRIG